MYSLEYDMVVQMLQQFRYSGEVHADVLPQAALRSGGRAVLVVLGGVVTSCSIFDKNGQKLYHGAKALSVVSRLGVLDWQLVTSPRTSVSTDSIKVVGSPQTPLPITEPIGITASLCPRRLAVPQLQMSNWSALHRSVYSLADGTRTIERIARLLSRPPNVIGRIIHDLQMSGAIDQLS